MSNEPKDLKKQAKRAADDAAGKGAGERGEGVIDETIGQVRQGVGRVIGDERMEAEGAAQELEGKARQVAGAAQRRIDQKADQAAADARQSADRAGDAARDAARDAKKAVGNALDKARDAIDGKPDTDPRR